MTWVKVCGLRTVADVVTAQESGANAIGLVLAPSPRQVDLATARRLAGAAEVAVFLIVVDTDADASIELAVRIGASGIQPYGAGARETAVAATRAGFSVLFPVRATVDFSVDDIPADQIPLIDNALAGKFGGTGEMFDHSLLSGIARPFVLAGGLGPANISAIIESVHPWGVDASSRLESSPGRKDPELITEFVTKAKGR